MGVHAQAAQVAGELVRAAVELVVAERALGRDGRQQIGMALRRFAKQLVHRHLAEALGRGVPGAEHLAALGGGHERQSGDARVGCGRGGREQHLEVTCHALDGGGVEEVAVVFPMADVALRAGREFEHQVETRRARLDRHRLGREAGDVEGRHVGVLEGEHHLEQRRSAQVARQL